MRLRVASQYNSNNNLWRARFYLHKFKYSSIDSSTFGAGSYIATTIKNNHTDENMNSKTQHFTVL